MGTSVVDGAGRRVELSGFYYFTIFQWLFSKRSTVRDVVVLLLNQPTGVSLCVKCHAEGVGQYGSCLERWDSLLSS